MTPMPSTSNAVADGPERLRRLEVHEPVVDHDHGLTRKLKRRLPASESQLAARQLEALASRRRVDQGRRDLQRPDDLVIEYTNAARPDRAHRQFLVARCPELAHDQDVQWQVEIFRDRSCRDHSASRESEHDGVRSASIVRERFRKPAASLATVGESGERRFEFHGTPPLFSMSSREAALATTAGTRDCDSAFACNARGPVTSVAVGGKAATYAKRRTQIQRSGGFHVDQR